ncbi:phage tail protein I [Paenibacillus provencensis]|uniref:Phage tail protein I n=1 Tax=Paenibacillus provencensis TaxID=441151 RepID=A0ABW3PUA9_9BACL|nr:phage tail protein I [Paenibacillus sp. MER 78]MCM3129026.1 phage tail protein I [Paenibacillus sp. MER 78]
MTDLENMSLLDLLPISIRYDPKVIAYAEALDIELKEVKAEARKIPIFSRLNELNDEEADQLAWGFNVSFYDVSLPIEQKRELVKNAYRFHRKKGTPAAVEELITILFGYGKVEEWFEYGGQRGYFRVITNNPEVTQEKAQEFIKAVDSIKRGTAHLETVILAQSETIHVYNGFAIHVGKNIRI